MLNRSIVIDEGSQFCAAYIFATSLLSVTLPILTDGASDDTTNISAHMISIEAVVVLVLCVEVQNSMA